LTQVTFFDKIFLFSPPAYDFSPFFPMDWAIFHQSPSDKNPNNGNQRRAQIDVEEGVEESDFCRLEDVVSL
jgi:hypothetical protein